LVRVTELVAAGVTANEIGVSGTVTLADFVGSVLLVAVSVDVAPGTGRAAVYIVAVPLAVAAGLKLPPPLTLHVTPAFALSLVTVAAKLWVAPPIIAAGVVAMLTLITGAGPLPPLTEPPLPHPASVATKTRLQTTRMQDSR